MKNRLRRTAVRNGFALTLVSFATLVLVALSTTAIAARPDVALRITHWEDGSRPQTRLTWTLRCDHPGGAASRPSLACARLTEPVAREAFRGMATDVVCTEIYGGPEVALVTGHAFGRTIRTRFSRENGCQIARWDRLVELGLLPG